MNRRLAFVLTFVVGAVLLLFSPLSAYVAVGEEGQGVFCVCETKCTEDEVNADCPVCAEDPSSCTADQKASGETTETGTDEETSEDRQEADRDDAKADDPQDPDAAADPEQPQAGEEASEEEEGGETGDQSSTSDVSPEGRQSSIWDAEIEAGKEIRRVTVALPDNTPNSEKLYELKTGQPLKYTVAIGNAGSMEMEDVVRIYFEFDGIDYSEGSFPPADRPYTIRNTSGTEYTMWVKECVDENGERLPGKFYYEITGIKSNETLAFQNTMLYKCPESAGGNLKIWTKVLSPEDAQANDGKYLPPVSYIEANWSTEPKSRTITKTNSSYIDGSSVKPHFEGDGVDTEVVYLQDLAYSLTESVESSTARNEGKDFIREIDYEDTITLPEGSCDWADGILDAIRSGDYTVKGEVVRSTYVKGYYGYSIYANVGGKQVLVASIQDRAYQYSSDYTKGVRNLTPVVVQDANGRDTIKLTWHADNPQKTSNSAGSEMPAKEFSVVIGDRAVAGDLDVLNEQLDAGEQPNINNAVLETRHYSWSDDQTSRAENDKTISLDASLETAKYWNNNNSNYNSYYGGADSPFTLYMKNTGIANLRDWGITGSDGSKQPMISDSMNYTMYITPENIAKMFSESISLGGDVARTCDWLTLTISPATLCTPNEGSGAESGQELFAGDNDATGGKYTNGIPSKDDTELTTGAVLTLQRVDGELVLRVSKSGAAGLDGSYTIGEGGDYPSVKAAFNGIGYEVTSGAIYKLEYQPDEGDFVLKSGQKLAISVPGSMKTTYMMLNGDKESYYGSSTISFRNQAVFRAHYDDENKTASHYSPYRYWNRESYLYKNGYLAAQGKSISGDNQVVDDGSVIDYNVYFYRYNQSRITTYYNYETKTETSLSSSNYIYQSKPYEKMPIRDLVSGPQVVLVPVTFNPDLKAPDGSELEVYTDDKGLRFWLLNKPGTYEDLTFGNATARVTTNENQYPYYHADTITVSEISGGGLSTLIKWTPLENWGGRQSPTTTTTSSGTTNMWYKVLVSGEKSGMASGADQQYKLNNKCWQGDHQRHRLYDTLGGYYRLYSFDKYIATGAKDGSDTVDDGTLIDDKRIRKGETVTYQIEIRNISRSESVLTGENLFDKLPQTRGVFSWTRDGQANVKDLRYVTSKASVTVQGEDGTADTWQGQAGGSWENGIGDSKWSISDTGRTSDPAAEGQQYILWDKDFRVTMQPGGSVKILVDLVFPAEGDGDTSVWANYVNKNNGGTLYNDFFLREQGSWYSDRVSHLPIADGKAVLRKGVYDTGWTTRNGKGTSTTWGYRYISRKDRNTFVNTGDTTYNSTKLHASTVTYYVELYNGSNERLYLEPLQDQLPKGFTFNGFANYNRNTSTDWDGQSVNTGYPGYIGVGRNSRTQSIYTDPSGSGDQYRLATVDTSIDESDGHTPQYVNAYVTQTTKMVDGHQRITFDITQGSASDYTNHPKIKYDSTVGRYYLDPGQAVRFGYNAIPGKYADTEDVAINTIGMPYYNYYDTDFELDDVEKLKPSTYNGLSPNDGGCEQMTNSEVAEEYGFDTSNYAGKEAYETEEDGNWLVSSATVTRKVFIPGTQKSVAGYTQEENNPSNTTIQGSKGTEDSLYGTAYSGGVYKNHVINWKIRAFSDDNSMTDYALVDTVDQPYLFTGQVFYNTYHMSGTSEVRESDTNYLFTIGSRKEGDTTVRVGSGSSLSSTKTIRIGKAEDDSDDDWYTFGSANNGTEGRMKIEKLANGKEQMTIKLTGYAYTIPENAFADFCVHSQFCSDTIVVSEGKYNDIILVPSADYRSSAVTKGRSLTHTETVDGKPVTVNDGVESGASLMVVQGYTTSSNKTITELAHPTNKAESEDSTNYIVLDEKENVFRYDAYVTGPKAVMSKIVLIDSLPEEGDHSAFVEDDKRNSDFTISLADEPDIHVYLKKKGGSETELAADKYIVEGTTKTDFNTIDWRGEGEGWKKISDMSADEIGAVRAIRLVIDDDDAWGTDQTKYMMPEETRVRLGFNARIDDEDAAAGEYGWNSFGYYYTVPQDRSTHFGIDLMAQPLKVGVRYPCAPEITKKLLDEDGSVYKAATDLTFRFLVYRGDRIDALANAQDMTESEIAEKLEGREYVVVPVKVKKGESEGKFVFWDKDVHLSEYDGAWKDREQLLKWVKDAQYNIIELPVGSYRFNLDSLKDGGNNQSFIQTDREVVALTGINRLFIERMDVRGHKVWNDDGDRDGVRPDEITIDLMADGKKIDSVTVGSGDDWEWAFTGLPRYKDDGSEIVYETKEAAVAKYETTYKSETQDPPEDTGGDAAGGDSAGGDTGDSAGGDADNSAGDSTGTDTGDSAGGDAGDSAGVTVHTVDTTVTNRHEPAETEVTATKIWDDDDDRDGLRPAKLTFHLFADGEEIDSAEVTEDDGWTATFEGLKIYRDHGTKIEYTVTEDEVTGYEGSYEVDADGVWQFTNKHEPAETEVTAAKTWDDDDDRDGLRPAKLTFHLFADGEEIDSAEVTEDDGWTATFDGLKVYRDHGTKIEYTVTEDEVTGYEGSYEVDADGVWQFTNKHEPAETEVTAMKTWDDDDDRDGLRPGSITFHLFADGKEIDSAEVTEDDGWTATFDGLKVYRDHGTKIEYTVTEDEVESYEGSGEETGDYIWGLTNIHKPDETDVTATKNWDDDGDRDGLRPGSITFRLFADGEEIDSAEVTADDGWTATFEGLKVCRDHGTKIEYTVTEDEVESYEGSGEETEDYTWQFTNKHEPAETEVSAAKTWDDDDDRDGLRPAKLTFHLFADGEEIDSAEVTADDGWTATFEGLKVCRDHGTKIEYTVTEDEVEGYEASCEVDADGVWQFTNKYVPEEKGGSGSGETKTGDGSHVLMALMAALLSGGIAAAILARRRREQ